MCEVFHTMEESEIGLHIQSSGTPESSTTHIREDHARRRTIRTRWIHPHQLVDPDDIVMSTAHILHHGRDGSQQCARKSKVTGRRPVSVRCPLNQDTLLTPFQNMSAVSRRDLNCITLTGLLTTLTTLPVNAFEV